MGKTFFWITKIFIIVLLFTQCSQTPSEPLRYERFALGTVCQITLYDRIPDEKVDAAFSELDRIEHLLSRHIETTEIGRFNTLSREAESSEVSFVFSDDAAELINAALDYAGQTGGRFNPAIGPLVDLWGIGTENARVPGQDEIDRVLPLLDWTKLKMEGNELTAPAGTSLDLGGIAKGYAADRISAFLQDEGIDRGIINFGGNVLVMGGKPDGSLWKIGLQNPRTERGDYVGVLSLKAMAMVTSGNYERFFEQDGKRYHHILDSDTGYPVDNNLAAVTIVTPLSVNADALSTSLYAMGLKEGMAFAESHDYFEAIFITKDDLIYPSSGVGKSFRLTDQDFTPSNL